MAGAGWRDFVTGEVVTEPYIQTYLMDQSVMVFASSAARATALSGVLAEGMISYLSDTNLLYFYDGAAWVQIPATINVRKNSTGTVYTQPRINFIEGTNITLTVGDDGSEIDVTITSSATTARTILNSWGHADPTGIGTSAVEQSRIIPSTGTAVNRMTMTRAGSVTGIMVALSSARTSGSLTGEVYKNGAATGLTVVIDGTNTQYHYTVQAPSLDTFVAGDELSVYAFETGTFQAGTSSVLWDIEVAYD